MKLKKKNLTILGIICLVGLFFALKFAFDPIKLSDDQIITAGLMNIKFGALSARYANQDLLDVNDPNGFKNITDDFMHRYPECCKVYRWWNWEIYNINPLFFIMGNVIVKVENEDRLLAHRSGKTVLNDKGIYFILVGEHGSELLAQYSPGG